MANLFIVYTPFQLMVAQEIIHQENLNNNVILKSHIGHNDNFYEIYDFLEIKGTFSRCYTFPNINTWCKPDLNHPFRSINRIKKTYRYIRGIIDDNIIDNIFIGNINNRSMGLTAKIFANTNIQINVFEEGSAHYHYKSNALLENHRFIARLYQFFFDTFLFKPICGIKLGYWLFIKPLPISKIPIKTRYSIIPYYQEKFDRPLIFSGIIGERAKKLIEKELSTIPQTNIVLFMDQPVYELVEGSETTYIETIREYLETLPENTNLVIKYHPREKVSIKEKIENMCKSIGLAYFIISQEINLPLELYLRATKFDNIINIASSSSLYNGYLFETTKFTYLIQSFYDKCIQANLEQAKNLQTLLNMQ